MVNTIKGITILSRHKPQKIKTNEICQFGCKSRANYQFKNKKICCSDAIQKCKGHINQVLTTKRNDIDENGLNAFQRGQKAATKVRDHNKAGESISKAKNKIVQPGLRNCDISNKKMKETKLTVADDGLTNAQRSARKMANTRLADIDNNGLNQYQRWTIDRIKNGVFESAWKKALLIKQYKNTNLYYQGSYEKRFLDSLVLQKGIEWVFENVKRGPVIKYKFQEMERNYMSDFIIDNTIYEVKSNWTWNKRGKDLLLEGKNITKLKAARDAGYKVKLIREGKEIDFV
jgi:hypothetical protein